MRRVGLLFGGLTIAATASLAGQSGDDATREDLLTFAKGALFVGQTGLASGSAGNALRMVDGDPTQLGLGRDDGEPIELVYKLPANTTFDRFAVPNVSEPPGNTSFFKTVVISGSLEGPDSGYEVLATAELEAHAADQQYTEIQPDVVTPVRWVRVHLEGALYIGEGQAGRTVLRFSEIIGNGVQETAPMSTAFSGLWDFRLTERTDLRGVPLELSQTGSMITGCLGTIALNGTVNGRIARATGTDARDGRPSAIIFVADEDDTIHGAWSQNRGVFGARSAVEGLDVEPPTCTAGETEIRFCGISVYVNFDVNSAVIRTESEQVLSDLYDGLVAEGATQVSIEGHTSTEGTVEHNQDLSERRAQAVVDDLISRGIDRAGISAVGRGETQPLLSPDDDESSREINRRVEIVCGQGG